MNFYAPEFGYGFWRKLKVFKKTLVVLEDLNYISAWAWLDFEGDEKPEVEPCKYRTIFCWKGKAKAHIKPRPPPSSQ